MIGGEVTFNNQVWDIEDGDIFTLTGIGYYYLSRGINPNNEEDIELEPVAEQYYIGSEIKLNTEMGYCLSVDATKNYYKIKERAMDYVIIVPTKAGILEVNTLKQGEIVTNSLFVEENI